MRQYQYRLPSQWALPTILHFLVQFIFVLPIPLCYFIILLSVYRRKQRYLLLKQPGATASTCHILLMDNRRNPASVRFYSACDSQHSEYWQFDYNFQKDFNTDIDIKCTLTQWSVYVTKVDSSLMTAGILTTFHDQVFNNNKWNRTQWSVIVWMFT
jgi:hypothetical protein